MKKPNLFEYLDVGLYLKDYYKFRKAKENGFSYELWVDELGLKSRGHLRSIVIGETKLTENLILDFIKGLKLNDPEAEYFALLTRYSTTTSNELKSVYGKTLLPFWKAQLHKIEISNSDDFLSDSAIPVVFTYLSFEDSACAINEICQALGYPYERVQNALKCLIWWKLIDGDVSPHGDIKYRTIKTYFNVPSAANNNYLKNFHIEGLALAKQAHDYPAEIRKYYSTFVAFSPEQFLEAQRMIQECQDRILAMVEDSCLGDRQIYRINVQVFPASHIQNTDQPEVL